MASKARKMTRARHGPLPEPPVESSSAQVRSARRCLRDPAYFSELPPFGDIALPKCALGYFADEASECCRENDDGRDRRSLISELSFDDARAARARAAEGLRVLASL